MQLQAVAWVCSQNKPTDALTKQKENTIKKGERDTGKISHPIEQYVIR